MFEKGGPVTGYVYPKHTQFDCIRRGRKNAEHKKRHSSDFRHNVRQTDTAGAPSALRIPASVPIDFLDPFVPVIQVARLVALRIRENSEHLTWES